jgi:hypothetical protein
MRKTITIKVPQVFDPTNAYHSNLHHEYRDYKELNFSFPEEQDDTNVYNSAVELRQIKVIPNSYYFALSFMP